MLKFEHVVKGYGSRKALDDLTVTFEPGRFMHWSAPMEAEKVP